MRTRCIGRSTSKKPSYDPIWNSPAGIGTNSIPMLVVISCGGLTGVLVLRCTSGLSNPSHSLTSGTTITAANALTTAITRLTMVMTETRRDFWSGTRDFSDCELVVRSGSWVGWTGVPATDRPSDAEENVGSLSDIGFGGGSSAGSGATV